METLNHSYRPKAWAMALASVFFGSCALFMGHEAIVNNRGLIIDGIIHLSPAGATVFYWCVAAVSGAFVAVGIPAFFVGLLSNQRIILTATEISAPRFSFSRAPTVVKLADVQDINLQVVQKQRFLNIYHRNGKLTITESHLPNRAAFEELCAAIRSRVPKFTNG